MRALWWRPTAAADFPGPGFSLLDGVAVSVVGSAFGGLTPPPRAGTFPCIRSCGNPVSLSV